MKTLHLMSGGGIGGIQSLMKQYANYSNNTNVYIFYNNDGLYCQELIDSSKKVYVLKLEKFKFIKLLQIIINENPDVIIEHFASPVLRIIIIISKLMKKNIKTVLYQHHVADMDGYYKKGVLKKVIRLINQYTYNHIDCVIAISNYVKKSIMKTYNIDQNKIWVNYNGVDLKLYNFPQNLKTHKIIYVGRLTEGKGVQNILKSLANLNVNWKFTVVGEGEFRSSLETITKQLNITDKVDFVGETNNAAKYLLESEIFIHIPIVEEGFGITIVEAMAAGLSIISNYSGGIPEIIKDNINGYLIDTNNLSMVTGKIEDLINNYNSEKNVLIRKKAKEDANSYSIKSYSNRLDKYLMDLCK